MYQNGATKNKGKQQDSHENDLSSQITKTYVLNLSFFITKRIASQHQASFSRFILRLSIAATALSVAAMVLSLSFINGFQKVVSEKVFSFWGHIRVQHYEPFKVSIAEEYPIEKNDSIEDIIRKTPGIAYFQAFATKSAILKSEKTIEGVLFKGVDKNYHFDQVESFRKSGHWPKSAVNGYSSEIMISEYLANQLSLKTGSSLLIYFIQEGQTQPRTRKLTISGIYKTGIELYDHNFIIGDIALIQKLNNWNNSTIGGYEIVLKDYSNLYGVNNLLYENLPNRWDSKTIKEIYPEIFDWLNLQNTNKYILISVMTVIAIINLISCLIILVMERTKMIGTLKALGSSNWMIQKIFLWQGAYITSIGVVLGLVVGLGLSYLQLYTGFIKLNEEAYYMATAPVLIVWWQVFSVCISTLFICTIILFIPSFISRKISPVKALQFR
jgi:lipoprotein-releasing system permease protein